MLMHNDCCMAVIQKYDRSKPVAPDDIRLLNTGTDLPCRHPMVAKLASKIPSIGERPSETLISYCYKPCPEEKAVEVVKDRYQ